MYLRKKSLPLWQIFVYMPNTRHRTYLYHALLVVLVVVATIALQVFTGDFPVDIFAFPLNIVCIVLWLTVVAMLYKNRQNITLAKLLLSPGATWLSLAIMAATGIYLGLQRQPNSSSWPVVMGILFVLTHLAFIILRGWRNSTGIRWRFTLLHIGLFLLLGAGFWGAPDREQLRVALIENRPTHIALHTNGTAAALDYSIELKGVKAEYAESGMPTHFEAEIKVDGIETQLTVNHPYNRTLGEKIYLISIGNDNNEPYCIVEVVREPWQWVSLAGIVMLLAGAVMLFIRGPRHSATNIEK